MDVLNEIVKHLNKEELRYFKIFALRQGSSEQRKDLALLDWLKKNNKSEDDQAFVDKHYNLNNKNAYYRLKNRLLDDISKSLVLQHEDDDELIQLFNLCGLVKIYLKKQLFQLAFHFLRKAE